MAGDLCIEHAWGFMASGVADAPGCISDCRSNFIKSLTPGYETFAGACEALANDNQTGGELLHALYCCSSQHCGVNNVEGFGHDPNVNWFINACQSIGYESIIDSGPPSPGYICRYGSLNGAQSHCQNSQLTTTTSTTSVIATSSEEFIIEDLVPFTTMSQAPSSFTTIRVRMPAITTIDSSHLPSLAATLNAATNQGDGDDSSSLTTGVKVTIALSVIAGVIVIIALIAWHIRFREHARDRRPVSRPIKPISFPGPADSLTPLVSPTNSYASPPLTPPRRLQERRFLIPRALSRHSDSQESAGVPPSPIRPSVHIHSRDGTLRAMSPTPTPASPRFFRGHHRGNALSGNISSSIGTFNHFPITPTDTTHDGQRIGLSAPRPPPRVYDGPHPVTGLISPGPPPNKALPKTPSDGQTSPKTSPLLPSVVVRPTQGNNYGIGIGIGPRSPLTEPHECEKIEEDISESGRRQAVGVGVPDMSRPPGGSDI
ncbi:hypothetical protein PT974_00263 [Cladobotryum mycophilum]|uniref:Extracellular membrane protein CFEM domain-containing protein n=1 Tax=Cladobotryum mycophilum TaxID=491253 RepID=A0ABR0T0L7_9HYPO